MHALANVSTIPQLFPRNSLKISQNPDLISQNKNDLIGNVHRMRNIAISPNLLFFRNFFESGSTDTSCGTQTRTAAPVVCVVTYAIPVCSSETHHPVLPVKTPTNCQKNLYIHFKPNALLLVISLLIEYCKILVLHVEMSRDSDANMKLTNTDTLQIP